MSSNVQAGLQAGSAFGPWGAAIGAAAGAVTDLGAQALGGSSTSGSWTDSRSAFDGSGWTVATGGSRATGGKSGGLNQSGATIPSQVGNSVPAIPGFGASLGGVQSADMSSLLIVGIGLAVLWAIL